MEINKLNARILSKFGESGAVFGVGALELVKDYPELLLSLIHISEPTRH